MDDGAESKTIRSIITRYYSSWADGRKNRADVIRAASAIRNCQTERQGWRVENCDCGHVSDLKFNSCRHRSCPQCRGGRRADWLQKMTADLLPCDHVHIIFTVPEQLNGLWSFNRALFAGLLMTAARESLEELLADPKYLGARPGILAALHTWGRTLSVHPHVHCLVSAGGVTADGQFVKSERSVLLPARVLHAVFRGKLCDFLRQRVASGELVLPPQLTEAKCRSLLNRAGRKRWNVRLEDRYRQGVSVAGYLARYMSGGPISDKRICSISDAAVVFRYRDHRDGKEKELSLSPHDFLTRCFEHVPPRGLRAIRRSGLYANCSRATRQAIRVQLSSEEQAESVREPEAAAARVIPLDGRRCPRCNGKISVRSVCPAPRDFVPASLVEGRRSGLPQPP